MKLCTEHEQAEAILLNKKSSTPADFDNLRSIVEDCKECKKLYTFQGLAERQIKIKTELLQLNSDWIDYFDTEEAEHTEEAEAILSESQDAVDNLLNLKDIFKRCGIEY